jgi:hypothetical protein
MQIMYTTCIVQSNRSCQKGLHLIRGGGMEEEDDVSQEY